MIEPCRGKTCVTIYTNNGGADQPVHSRLRTQYNASMTLLFTKEVCAILKTGSLKGNHRNRKNI